MVNWLVKVTVAVIFEITGVLVKMIPVPGGVGNATSTAFGGQAQGAGDYEKE